MKRWLIVVLATLFVGVAGVAVASIPAADGTINGCYSDAIGALRVIDSEGTCPNGTTPLNWNQTGPAGEPGSPGVSGYEVVTGPTYVFQPGQPINNVTAVAACPPGKNPVGGGFVSSFHFSDQFVVTHDAPTLPPFDPGWLVGLNHYPWGEPLNAGGSLNAYAICVYVEE